MPTSKRSRGPLIMVSMLPPSRTRFPAPRPRGKRNRWVVVAFMALLVATWINALL